MSAPGEPGPKDPTVPIETPESRMTGAGGPPPEPEEDEGPQDGPDYDATEMAHRLEPQEPTGPAPARRPQAGTEPVQAQEPEPRD
ncbi:hypothetical protein [Streptomyces sp. CBMA123]|uniref:hypothetical protein n=1 Tax=Streptomyces sp. CBMA123 TaxID=1896313 RepID=UPI00166204F1|nr:hypothetical protein [Streptomyces sp. CBMA123]MBD0690783.1 hypothetical protein [Streptomyces sp. CBMA123]